MRTPREVYERQGKANRNGLCAPSRPRRDPPTRRINFLRDSVSVWAWPSRGGLIVLEQATPVDFDFLGFDTVHPPIRRHRDQDAEDALCQKLLLLGAKWFDSEARFSFVWDVGDENHPAALALEAGEVPQLTRMERRWVRVAVVGAGGMDRDADRNEDGEKDREQTQGGLWVLEYDTSIFSVMEPKNLQPGDTGRVTLARTMEERCEILKAMGASFFPSPDLYEGGAACVAAWKRKTEGEVGPLVKTQYEDEQPTPGVDYSKPDMV